MRRIKEELLSHDRHIICGKVAEYKLTKLTGRNGEYLISVYYCKDKAVHRICGRIEEAIRIYKIIEQNSVMPCTLSDVVLDMTYPAE